MSDTLDLKTLSEGVADRLRAEFPRYDGHDVRVDAGDPGMIYVAIRGARREHDTGRALAEELGEAVEGWLADEPTNVEFAISMGTGNDDLLLQIELREV